MAEEPSCKAGILLLSCGNGELHAGWRLACRDEVNVGFPDFSKHTRQALGYVLILIIAISGFLRQLPEHWQLLHHLQQAKSVAFSKASER